MDQIICPMGKNDSYFRYKFHLMNWILKNLNVVHYLSDFWAFLHEWNGNTSTNKQTHFCHFPPKYLIKYLCMSSLWKKKNSDDTSSKIGADEIGNLFIQTLNSYVRGLSLKIDSFWQKKKLCKNSEKIFHPSCIWMDWPRPAGKSRYIFFVKPQHS